MVVKTRVEQLIERWENAARVMRKLTKHERKKHFDMSVWGQETLCGTAACVAGYCALDSWFQKRGVKATIKGGGMDWSGSKLFAFQGDDEVPDPFYQLPFFFGSRGYRAVILGQKYTSKINPQTGNKRMMHTITFAEAMAAIREEIKLLKTVGEG
jgi:hypothetical protein